MSLPDFSLFLNSDPFFSVFVQHLNSSVFTMYFILMVFAISIHSALVFCLSAGYIVMRVGCFM